MSKSVKLSFNVQITKITKTAFSVLFNGEKASLKIHFSKTENPIKKTEYRFLLTLLKTLI